MDIWVVNWCITTRLYWQLHLHGVYSLTNYAASTTNAKATIIQVSMASTSKKWVDQKQVWQSDNLGVTLHYNKDMVHMGNFKYTNSGMYNCYWLEQYSLSAQHSQWDPVTYLLKYWTCGMSVYVMFYKSVLMVLAWGGDTNLICANTVKNPISLVRLGLGHMATAPDLYSPLSCAYSTICVCS